MYNEIEELEQKLGRKPASMNLEPIDVDGVLLEKKQQDRQKTLFDVPESSKPKDGQAAVPATSFSSEKIVGGVDPDFSGYDDLLKRIEGLKPRDTAVQDLINMGISTGIGVMFGQTGAGAKVAGQYGLDRYKKAEKKADEIEQMILKIQMDKAAKMAAGKKGQKVKSGSGSANWRAQIRIGEDGAQYWMTNVDPATGKFVPSKDDQRLTPLSAKMVDLPQPDGSTIKAPMAGNLIGTQPQARKSEAKILTDDAEGNKMLIGKTTGAPTQIGGEGFNTTSRGISRKDDKYYEGLEKEYTLNAKHSATANTDAQNAISALGTGDEAGAIVSLKSAIRAMEQGKMSDKDFDVVRDNLGSSWATKLDAWQGRVLEGQPLNNPQRQVLKNIAATLKANTEREHRRWMDVYNEKLKKVLTPEEFRRLSFRPQLRGYTSDTQKKDVDSLIKERNQYQADNYVLKRDSSGKIWKTLPEPGPDGKFKVIEEYIP